MCSPNLEAAPKFFPLVFQYFIVNSNDATTKVIDTVKLPTCTHLDQRKNVTLRGGIASGKFTKHGFVKDLPTCIDACCRVRSINELMVAIRGRSARGVKNPQVPLIGK